MNKTECENCKRVMEEGIRNANQAIKEFTEANETDSRVHFEILRMKAENHRGYSEGIQKVFFRHLYVLVLSMIG